MPKLNLSIPHYLNSSEVKSRLQKHLADSMVKEFGVEIVMMAESWDNSKGELSFMINGYSLSISLQLKSDEVSISGNIPLVALPYRKQIKRELLGLGLKLLQS